MHQPIRWRRLGEAGWTPGTLVDGLDGLYAVQLTDNPRTYLSTDRNGSTKSEPHIGAWEGRYELSSSTPTLRIKPNVITYVLEVEER